MGPLAESQTGPRTGPLTGYRIVEFAGVGPGPHCAMLLAEMGADVIRIDRPGPGGLESAALGGDPARNTLNRSRRSIAIDLKHEKGAETALRLVAQADALIEGYRPGAMERLGLGPEVVLARNPKLVYGRITGWGQDGPLAKAAGHDLNYIALSGALAAIGPGETTPVPPLNLVADMGGGALYLALGIVAGLLEASKSGTGQIVDAAMVDGAASLMSFVCGMQAMGLWADKASDNFLAGRAPHYQVYETSDGKYISVAPLEEKFFAILLDKLGLDAPDYEGHLDPQTWPDLSRQLATIFAGRTREEWCRLLEGSDACFAPVLEMGEAPDHAHNKARGSYVTIDGVVQPGLAPRFSRTPGKITNPPPVPGAQSVEILADWGFDEAEIDELKEKNCVFQHFNKL